MGEGGRRRRECDERTRYDRGEIGLDSDDVCATPPIDIYPPMGGGEGKGNKREISLSTVLRLFPPAFYR